MALHSLQMALSRMQFEGLGFSMVLRAGWKGVAMNPLHGAFISSPEQEDAVLNVRCMPSESKGEGDGVDREALLTGARLETMLREQSWGAPPRDLFAAESPPFAMVGASFAPAEGRSDWVREWFITDGKSLANAMATPLICLRPELIAECEEMLRSLRFD